MKVNKLIEIIENIYNTSQFILFENQEVLSKIFLSDCKKENVIDDFGQLLQKQKLRGDYVRCITSLNEEIELKKFDEEILHLLKQFLNELNAFFETIYYNRGKSEVSKISTYNSISRPNLSKSDIQSIVGGYLEFLRVSIENMGIVIEKIIIRIEKAD